MNDGLRRYKRSCAAKKAKRLVEGRPTKTNKDEKYMNLKQIEQFVERTLEMCEGNVDPKERKAAVDPAIKFMELKLKTEGATAGADTIKLNMEMFLINGTNPTEPNQPSLEE